MGFQRCYELPPYLIDLHVASDLVMNEGGKLWRIPVEKGGFCFAVNRFSEGSNPLGSVCRFPFWENRIVQVFPILKR